MCLHGKRELSKIKKTPTNGLRKKRTKRGRERERESFLFSDYFMFLLIRFISLILCCISARVYRVRLHAIYVPSPSINASGYVCFSLSLSLRSYCRCIRIVAVVLYETDFSFIKIAITDTRREEKLCSQFHEPYSTLSIHSTCYNTNTCTYALSLYLSHSLALSYTYPHSLTLVSHTRTNTHTCLHVYHAI